MKNGYQLYNTQVSPPITHTKACSPHLSACRCNISFICTVLCKLVGVQTCASCCVMLSSRWILPPLSQAWGKSKASLSFMFYYHGSASLLTQAASAGQCVRISKRWPGKDFCFQGDRIMFYWVPDSWYRVAAGGVCDCAVWSTSRYTPGSICVQRVCLHIFNLSASTCLYDCYLFISVCDVCPDSFTNPVYIFRFLPRTFLLVFFVRSLQPTFTLLLLWWIDIDSAFALLLLLLLLLPFPLGHISHGPLLAKPLCAWRRLQPCRYILCVFFPSTLFLDLNTMRSRNDVIQTS